MAEMKRLVFAVIEFLDDQIVSGELTEDAVESLEVAKQCLETAYGLDLSQDTEYRVNPGLLDIFNAVVGAPNIVKRAPSEEGIKEAEKLKIQGNECMKVDNYKDALDFYSQAIKLDWTKSVYFCNRAAAYSKVNNHSAAICDCKKAIEIDKDYSKAYGRMGLAYMGMLDYTSARECYKKALELEPDNEGYKTNLETAEKQAMEASRSAFGGAGASGGIPGMPGGFNLSALMSDPNIMSMAQNLMTRPEMRNMMAGMFSGQASGENAGLQDLMKKTYDLASQMQSEQPDLVDNLRQQYRAQGEAGDGSAQEKPEENATEDSKQPEEEDKKDS
ncbi:small glutamine-rich tetratricopeptide repeat-containing protein alpha-like isoform X2 [Lineus longissimus]|uniref:small glutamine-rich tetratricopeptide repeat-containing protein alpha-like isoform X2 n=1 Tax=Lineus longissimus TaxID=88925 RepID=UPI002B4D7D6F